MLRIGAFAKLAGATVKTLRLYDHEGLLEPAHIDARTGYRYYEFAQVSRLRLIRRLRALDFSIGEIRRLVERGVEPARLHHMLVERRVAIEEQLNASRSRLAEIRHWMSALEAGGGIVPPFPSLRLEPAGPVATLRRTVNGCAGAAALLGELAQVTRSVRPAAPPVTIWHGCPSRHASVDCEVRVAVPAGARDHGDFTLGVSPARLIASVVHVASDGPIGASYGALRRWIARQGMTVAGPVREVYWRGEPTIDDASDVTEIQFPVHQSRPAAAG